MKLFERLLDWLAGPEPEECDIHCGCYEYDDQSCCRCGAPGE